MRFAAGETDQLPPPPPTTDDSEDDSGDDEGSSDSDDPAPSRDRPSVLAVELLLDPDTEAAVGEEWRALAATGLSSMGARSDEHHRPHVTVLVRPGDAPVPDVVVDRALLPLTVTLGAPVLFGRGDRRVLARSVIPTLRLLELHRAVHAAAGDDDGMPHLAPGEWTPHVTLARRLRVNDLPAALACVGGDLAGSIVDARVWDSRARTVRSATG